MQVQLHPTWGHPHRKTLLMYLCCIIRNVYMKAPHEDETVYDSKWNGAFTYNTFSLPCVACQYKVRLYSLHTKLNYRDDFWWYYLAIFLCKKIAFWHLHMRSMLIHLITKTKAYYSDLILLTKIMCAVAEVSFSNPSVKHSLEQRAFKGVAITAHHLQLQVGWWRMQ